MLTRLIRRATLFVCSLIPFISSGCVAAAGYAAAVSAPPFVEGGPPAPPLACTLSGPYRANNLTVFLLHGAAQPPERPLLALADAMDQGLAGVDETGSVNQLRVHNRCDDEIFIQGGQIVKGGRQDRTLAFDLLLGPRTSTPIDAFCVEHGRWTGRSGDSSANFSAPGGLVASQELRLAVMDYASQSAVWNAVSNVQGYLARSVKQDVASPQSPTSLQLTLENQTLQSQMREYVNGLSPLVHDHPDATGYVCAINGRIVCAEVYGSPALFRQLWPKLLNANAVESIAAMRDRTTSEAIEPASVMAVLHHLEQGAPATRAINDRTTILRYASEEGVLFQTVNPGGGWLHRTYLCRGDGAARR